MKRSLLVVGAAVAVGGAAIGLYAAFAAVAWHWVEVHTGTVNESGPYYGFFSGFGSDIGEVVLIGGVVTLVRHHNCHEQGCWRIGKHTTPEGYKLCKLHVGKPKSELTLHPIHSDHA